MKVHVLRAAHQSTPGIVSKVFATRELANVEAAELVNLMIASEDEYNIATAYADDWEMVLDDLVRFLELDDDESPFVEIVEMDVIGA